MQHIANDAGAAFSFMASAIEWIKILKGNQRLSEYCWAKCSRYFIITLLVEEGGIISGCEMGDQLADLYRT